MVVEVVVLAGVAGSSTVVPVYTGRVGAGTGGAVVGTGTGGAVVVAGDVVVGCASVVSVVGATGAVVEGGRAVVGGVVGAVVDTAGAPDWAAARSGPDARAPSAMRIPKADVGSARAAPPSSLLRVGPTATVLPLRLQVSRHHRRGAVTRAEPR